MKYVGKLVFDGTLFVCDYHDNTPGGNREHALVYNFLGRVPHERGLVRLQEFSPAALADEINLFALPYGKGLELKFPRTPEVRFTMKYDDKRRTVETFFERPFEEPEFIEFFCGLKHSVAMEHTNSFAKKRWK